MQNRGEEPVTQLTGDMLPQPRFRNRDNNRPNSSSKIQLTFQDLRFFDPQPLLKSGKKVT